MPRFFLDIHANGRVFTDEEGVDLSGPEAVRKEAMAVLPAIAKDEVPRDGDNQSYVVMVRDEAGKPVYSATLAFAGVWFESPGSS